MLSSAKIFLWVICVCVCVCSNVGFIFFISAEFPLPKTELVQKFHVLYLGMTSVSRPIGKIEPKTVYRQDFLLAAAVDSSVHFQTPLFCP